MKKKYRLLKKDDFQLTMNNKKIIYLSQGLMVFFHPNQINQPRFGIIVPKKRVKLAVRRNYLKRLIRSAIVQSNISLYPNNDYVFLVRNYFNSLQYSNLVNNISSIINRTKPKP